MPCAPSVSPSRRRAGRVVDGRGAGRRGERLRVDAIEKMGFTPDYELYTAGAETELEGRPRRRAHARHRLSRPRLHRVDVGCRQAHARTSPTPTDPFSRLASRPSIGSDVGRGDAVMVHVGRDLPADDVEHRHRPVVSRRRGRASPRRVRRRRTPRPPLQARSEHSLPLPHRVPHHGGAPGSSSGSAPHASAASSRPETSSIPRSSPCSRSGGA